MAETDGSLVARVRLGDAAVFETLLRRHFRTAYLIALARVNNAADAEDVCQEAFVKAWRHIDDCRQPDRFAPWLSQIVRNAAHNRRDYLQVRATEDVEAAAHVASPGRTDARVLQGELRERLQSALSELGDVQREIVLLHDLEGWRHAEIAT